jgi:hypothetical protein
MLTLVLCPAIMMDLLVICDLMMPVFLAGAVQTKFDLTLQRSLVVRTPN